MKGAEPPIVLMNLTAIFGCVNRAEELREQEECGDKDERARPVSSVGQADCSHVTLDPLPDGSGAIVII